jgi:hypothetical protein
MSAVHREEDLPEFNLGINFKMMKQDPAM